MKTLPQLADDARQLCYDIEALPAGEQQTKCSLAASGLSAGIRSLLPIQSKVPADAKEARIIDDKELRAAIEALVVRMKASPIKSAERMLAYRVLQTAKHWLGEDLREAADTNPYPEANNPSNAIVDPKAD